MWLKTQGNSGGSSTPTFDKLIGTRKVFSNQPTELTPKTRVFATTYSASDKSYLRVDNKPYDFIWNNTLVWLLNSDNPILSCTTSSFTLSTIEIFEE